MEMKLEAVLFMPVKEWYCLKKSHKVIKNDLNVREDCIVESYIDL